MCLCHLKAVGTIIFTAGDSSVGEGRCSGIVLNECILQSCSGHSAL